MQRRVRDLDETIDERQDTTRDVSCRRHYAEQFPLSQVLKELQSMEALAHESLTREATRQEFSEHAGKRAAKLQAMLEITERCSLVHTRLIIGNALQ